MPILPESAWQLVDSHQASLQDLEKLGSQTAVEREFGVKSVVQRTYREAGISVTAFFEEAADPSSAYGLLTFYQRPDMHPVHGLELAMVGRAGALMARGRYFIRVPRPEEARFGRADLQSLLTTIGGAKLTPENAEALPQGLPKQGLVVGTEKYLLGVQAAQRVLGNFPVSLIGFQDGVEAFTGMYVSNSKRLRLLAVSYPTPQLAQIKYRAMHHALDINQNRSSTPVYGRLDGSYALLVLNANSSESANRFLSQFKVSQFLTWSPHDSDASIAYQLVTLILANLELVGIIILFAIAAGILGVIGKRLIIRYFPESAFSKGQENQLIKLKL